MDLSDKYVFCKEANITSGLLFSELDVQFPTGVHVFIKKGLILELLLIQKAGNLSWITYTRWIEKLMPEYGPLSEKTVRRAVLALHAKKQSLQKRASARQQLEELLHQQFIPPGHRSRETTPVVVSEPMQSVFMKDVTQTLASEVVQLQEKCTERGMEIAKSQIKIQEMESKLKECKPHNVKRRIQRKDKKILQQKENIEVLEKEVRKVQKRVAKNTQEKIRYYKAKTKTLQEQQENECEFCDELEKENQELKKRNLELLDANASLNERLQEAEARKVSLYDEGKYNDSVRMCVMKLLSCNVGIRQVEPVIRAVFELAGVECDRLPKKTVINEMLIESRSLAQLQLAEVLTSTENNTLHSDGTTKFGHKYIGYQVNTDEGSLSLGLQEVSSGTAQATLQSLQDIVEEVSQTAEQKGGSSDVGKTIIAKIKSTMSDRANVQKSFNSMLSEYRAEVLPSVTANWESLTNNEKESMSQMYNFFCGMHLVVNMAEHLSETLKLFENAHEATTTINESGSGTVRLIRTACKAFEKRGDEKSGCSLPFSTYLKREGIDSNPLIHFRGNRFNVIFANGARVYYLRKYMVHFLTNIWGTTNRLLKAVLEDAKNDLYMAGCITLGLIDKFITTPLWRILESDIHILEVQTHYDKLYKFLKDFNNTEGFMSGEDIPFPEIRIIKDAIWAELITPSPLDPIVEQMVLSCFKSLELLVQHVISDHKPTVSIAQRSETTTVRKTNTVSERDFAQLDRLLREKPNSTLLSLEAHILFSNNKTLNWIATKSPEEVKELMERARKIAPVHKKKFQERLSSIAQERVQAQEERQREKEAAERRALAEKEKITSEIIRYGLWQTADDIELGLKAIKSETKMRQALKVQLKFRKIVLQQQYPSDKDVYHFSKKGTGQFNSTLLRDNLLKLIQAGQQHRDTTQAVAGLATVEVNLVGKRIQQVFNDNDEFVTYYGSVISQVPGFPEWFNVVYDDEEHTVYTYKLLDDFKAGDLKVMR